MKIGVLQVYFDGSPGPAPFSVGKHSTGFSSSQKGHVGHQSRPKERLFSSRRGRKSQTLPLHASRPTFLPMGRSSIRVVHPPLSFSISHEATLEKMERARSLSLGVLRRHLAGECQPKSFGKRNSLSSPRSRRPGPRCEPQKVCAEPHSAGNVPGLQPKLQNRMSGSAPAKIENSSEGTREVGHPHPFETQKSGGHFGHRSKFPHCTSIFKGIHRSTLPVCEAAGKGGMGHPTTTPKGPSNTVGGSQTVVAKLARKENGGRKNHSQASTVGCLGQGLGWNRLSAGHRFTRILEGLRRVAYKCKRVICSSSDCEKFGKTKRKSASGGGQFSGLQLHQKVRGQETCLQPAHAPFSEMVQGNEHKSGSEPRKECTDASRFLIQKRSRQRGLHFAKKYFSAGQKAFLALGSARLGYVCKPWKCPTGKVGFQVPSLRGFCLQRPGHGLATRQTVLGKPSLDSNSVLAEQTSGSTLGEMRHGSPLVGWKLMVAPTSQTARQGSPSNFSSAKVGFVQQLPGRTDASYKMAPSLCSVVRLLLERKQVPDQGISLYLKPTSTLERYDGAFRTFWAFCQKKGFEVPSLTVEQVASFFMQMSQVNSNQAKHLFSASLMLPGFESLRFSPLLRTKKRKWNSSVPKYSDFWDAEKVFSLLLKQSLNWSSVKDVRNRLILVFRLLHLCRSIDLQRALRTLSLQGDRLFLLIRRKNQSYYGWEEVMQLPGAPSAT